MSRPIAVKNLKGTPHIHVHFRTAPEFGESHGFMRAELVCHACRQGIALVYDYPRGDRPEEPALADLRHGFQTAHRHALRRVQHTLGTTTCPPVILIGVHDLRRYGRWTHLLRWLRIR